MPVYLWEGKRRNENVNGEMDAADEAAVRAQLLRMGITAQKVKKKPKDLFANVAFLQPGVTQQNIIIFARQFSTMIDAGLPIVQCLDILQAQEQNKTFQKILKTIKADVEGGLTLAEALKKHPKQFDALFVNMIAAGEAGGILDKILQRLSTYMEKNAKLKRQIKGAMMYPLITLSIAVLVVIVILVFVIPVFQQMFADFGKALPLPTQIVVTASEIVKSKILFIIAGMVLLSMAYRQFYKTEKGRLVMDGIFLKLPVIGVVIRKSAVARFTQTMGTMLSSGVSILDALDIVAKTAGNKVIENAVYFTRAGISEGRTVADPLSETGVFPSMVCSMIAVGESTGALDAMMEKIAAFYEEEVDAAVEAMTSAIEPLMMVFMGGLIGGLVVAMYLPVFQMAGAISGG
ncbi:MAG: type II secretion system F family protein [Thermodesulfobacteriota bacterium]